MSPSHAEQSSGKGETLSWYAPLLVGCVIPLFLSAVVLAQKPPEKLARQSGAGLSVPTAVLVRIVRAEDERRWDSDLSSLLADQEPLVRRRAALAVGRIGDARAVAPLVSLLQGDGDDAVRAMAAFSLGEIESAAGADALIAELQKNQSAEVKARAVEALGKIAANLPNTEAERAVVIRKQILGVLNSETSSARSDREVARLALTAALRAKPVDAGATIARFLSSTDAAVRADAANVLARLRVKDGAEQLRNLLTNDPDPIVRANAARALGAAENQAAFESLLDGSTHDRDSRVRISAIRALASLKDSRAAEPLLSSAEKLLQKYADVRSALRMRRSESNEILELATALGRLLPGTENERILTWLKNIREGFRNASPEVEIAIARISPRAYVAEFGTGPAAGKKIQGDLITDWRTGASRAQALAEIASLPASFATDAKLSASAQALLHAMLDYRNSRANIDLPLSLHPEYGIPNVLGALAVFKPKDLGAILRAYLKESDVIIRATAAELLGNLPPDEVNVRELIEALQTARHDEMNDASLAILEALAKQKSPVANEALRTALDSSDHLIRRRAVALLKANAVGDFSNRIGTVQTRNSLADYRRAIARIGKRFTASVNTSKGAFSVELLPEDAPLTVDNFVVLARRGFFNGQAIPRVVPNFVIQAGDPRGDLNGGPGYQIRCEINESFYDRGAVGMALSGKDTGGSQWFVTHSPQPHLDGGYTVFGRVVAGMEVVDSIARGDVIKSISVTESGPQSRKIANSKGMISRKRSKVVFRQ
jgi:cyclophilin family peptidyl-prolyl cis-trans isomerase/HEAT repeat protein